MAPFFRERAGRLEQATRARVEVVEVENRLFGPTVTVAGLLPGEDVLQALHAEGGSRPEDVVLLPAEALNGDDLFIDSLPLEAFRARVGPARVAAGYEVTRTLGELEGA